MSNFPCSWTVFLHKRWVCHFKSQWPTGRLYAICKWNRSCVLYMALHSVLTHQLGITCRVHDTSLQLGNFHLKVISAFRIMINVQENDPTERHFLNTGKLLARLTLQGGELMATVSRTNGLYHIKIQSCVVWTKIRNPYLYLYNYNPTQGIKKIMFIMIPYDIDLLVRNVYTIKKNTVPILHASRDVGLEVNTEKLLSIKNVQTSSPKCSIKSTY